MTDNLSDNVTDFSFLQGVKVIDFTQFEAGPSCTEALAWLGADVVKVENPKMGDPGRRLRPGKPDNDPYYFHMFNANKKSITLNLKSPEGLELAKEMIAKADVMMENFAPGAIERLGLSYDVVKAINPGIIYAQVKGFGEGSPFEKNLAFDMIAQAAGGTFSVTGDQDGPPTRPGITIGDTGTGMLMAITILGALFKRKETGEGHRLQVATIAQTQGQLAHLLHGRIAAYSVGGGRPVAHIRIRDDRVDLRQSHAGAVHTSVLQVGLQQRHLEQIHIDLVARVPADEYARRVLVVVQCIGTESQEQLEVTRVRLGRISIT